MKVKAWKGGTYGIRVGRSNARDYFNPDWDTIEVEINGTFYIFNLSSTFWTTCPEFRGRPITNWLRSQGLTKWPSGNPPVFELIPLRDNKFKLSRYIRD